MFPGTKGAIKDTNQIELAPLRILAERSMGASDKATLALVVEGGGMSGVVSGGMALVLEDLGLIDYFDFIIGCSAGALNTSYIASGKARHHAPLYIEVAREKGFIDKRRAFWGRPVMNLDILFDKHMVETRPYGDRVLEYKGKLHILCLNLESGDLEAISNFQNEDEVRFATRASCTIPGITGEPVFLRNSLYADGGLIESVPYKTALNLGATHCLVLRSRTASYRKPPFTLREKMLGKILLSSSGDLVKSLVSERNSAYNRDAHFLSQTNNKSPIGQICPPEGIYLPDTFESSPKNLFAGFLAGINAMQKHLID